MVSDVNQQVTHKFNLIEESSLVANILSWISFLTGIFITMPILTIQIQNTHISVFSLLYVIFIFLLAVMFVLNIDNISLGKSGIVLSVWFFLAVGSSIFGLFYFQNMPEWFSAVLPYIPKVISYFALLIIISSSRYKDTIIEAFFKGFFLGCIFNIMWANIEGIIFYIKGFSVNNTIFKSYIETLPPERQFITIITAGGIRTPGFNYDPAHLGGIIPIVTLYAILKKKYSLLILAAGALIFSQSTTALISTVALVLLQSFKIVKNNLRLTYKKIIAVLAIIPIILILTIPARNSPIYQSLESNLSGFSNRIINVYLKNKEPDLRTLYHLKVPNAAMYNNFKMVTGTGFGSASFPYVHDPDISEQLDLAGKGPYDPESTYISYLFDTGIIGFLIYAYILYKLYSYYSKKWQYRVNLLILASLGGIIFSGFFYHYTLTAYQVLAIIMASVYKDDQLFKKEGICFEEGN